MDQETREYVERCSKNYPTPLPWMESMVKETFRREAEEIRKFNFICSSASNEYLEAIVDSYESRHPVARVFSRLNPLSFRRICYLAAKETLEGRFS